MTNATGTVFTVVGSYVCAALSVTPCAAQRIEPSALMDSSPRRIMAASPNFVYTEVLDEILRQRHKQFPEAKRRELGDSLVQRSIGTRGDPVSSFLVIKRSGSSAPLLGGTPDSNAMNLLVRIYQLTTNEDVKRHAINGVVEQVNPGRAIPFLRSVVESKTDDASAFASVAALEWLAFGTTNPRITDAEHKEAEAALHALFDGHAVRGYAGLQLCRLGAARAWEGMSKCGAISP